MRLTPMCENLNSPWVISYPKSGSEDLKKSLRDEGEGLLLEDLTPEKRVFEVQEIRQAHRKTAC